MSRAVAKASRPSRGARGDAARLIALTGMLLGLVATFIWSVTVGTSDIRAGAVLGTIFAFDGSRDHLVIATLRLPRALAGVLAGSALAVAGAIMQAVTNNPLASPGLLGINAGAAFAVVVATSLIGIGSQASIWCAFGGAAAAAVIVYVLASLGHRGATPLKLVLAGAVLSMFLGALTTTLLLFDQATLDAVRLWTAGSLSGRTAAEVGSVAPYILAGLIAALLLRRNITTLSLGAELARSVGQDAVAWRWIAVVIVTLLAGGAVALAGPVGFVGLVVPHVARMIVGGDYRWIIPFCAVGGGLILVFADTAGRAFFDNQGFPVGVTMAMVGAPFFIWLARTRTVSAA